MKIKDVYTISELKKLKLGDKVLTDFESFDDSDGFEEELSEVVLIEPDCIYFNNDYGTWDFPLIGNNSNLSIQNTGDYIFKVYKK